MDKKTKDVAAPAAKEAEEKKAVEAWLAKVRAAQENQSAEESARNEEFEDCTPLWK